MVFLLWKYYLVFMHNKSSYFVKFHFWSQPLVLRGLGKEDPHVGFYLSLQVGSRGAGRGARSDEIIMPQFSDNGESEHKFTNPLNVSFEVNSLAFNLNKSSILLDRIIFLNLKTIFSIIISRRAEQIFFTSHCKSGKNIELELCLATRL